MTGRPLLSGNCESRESKPAKPFARGWVRFGGNSKDSLG